MKKGVELIAIGASAGGIEILRKIVPQLRREDNLSYVILQHTTAESKLVDFLGSISELDVVEVNTTLVIKKNTIYVAEPNRDLVIENRTLHVQKACGVASPSIDTFLLSFAQSYGENSIAVLLSGSGHDGWHGLKNIQKAGGISITLEPSEASFDSMIQNAIKNGVVSLVVSSKEFRKKILELLAHDSDERKIYPKLPLLFEIIQEKSSIDFSNFKESLFVKKIINRLRVLQLDIDAYLELLENSSSEIERVLDMLLIGVTSFFRDKSSFEALKKSIANQGKKSMKVWVACCSTGKEVYSLAILLEELGVEYKIFATDVNEKALNIARKALYKRVEIETIVDFQDYFEEQEGEWKIKDSIRQKVFFAKHDLIQEAPFLNMDLISCRNFFIYLKKEAQERVLKKFHAGLVANGILFLGKSENIGVNEWFKPINTKDKIYLHNDIMSADLNYYNYQIDSFHTEKNIASYIVFDNAFSIKKVVGNFEKIAQTSSAITLQEFFHGRIFDLLFDLIEQSDGGKRVEMIEGDFYLLKVVALENNLYILFVEELENFNDELESIKYELLQEKKRVEQLLKRLDKKEAVVASRNEEIFTVSEELKASNEELHATNEELAYANEELQSNYSRLKKEEVKAKEALFALEKKSYAVELLKEELQKQKAFLEKVLDAQEKIIFMVDKKSKKIIYANRSALNFFGDNVTKFEEIEKEFPSIQQCIEKNFTRDGQDSEMTVSFTRGKEEYSFECHIADLGKIFLVGLTDVRGYVQQNRAIEALLEKEKEETHQYLRALSHFDKLVGYDEMYSLAHFQFKRDVTQMFFLFEELNEICDNQGEKRVFEEYKERLINLMDMLGLFFNSEIKEIKVNHFIENYLKLFALESRGSFASIEYRDREGYFEFFLLILFNMAKKANTQVVDLLQDSEGFWIVFGGEESGFWADSDESMRFIVEKLLEIYGAKMEESGENFRIFVPWR